MVWEEEKEEVEEAGGRVLLIPFLGEGALASTRREAVMLDMPSAGIDRLGLVGAVGLD